MAHIVHRTVYTLLFDDGPLAGATVRARSTSTGQFLDIAALAVEADDNTKAAVQLFDLIGRSLVSWDLVEEDGTEIPCDAGGLRSLEPSVAMLVVSAFMEAVGGVPGPLSVTSNGGGPSLEDSMPMARLPASLAI